MPLNATLAGGEEEGGCSHLDELQDDAPRWHGVPSYPGVLGWKLHQAVAFDQAPASEVHAASMQQDVIVPEPSGCRVSLSRMPQGSARQ